REGACADSLGIDLHGGPPVTAGVLGLVDLTHVAVVQEPRYPKMPKTHAVGPLSLKHSPAPAYLSQIACAGLSSQGSVRHVTGALGVARVAVVGSRYITHRRNQFRLELTRERDVAILVQVSLAVADCCLHKGFHGGSGDRIRIFRANDLVGDQYNRVGAG